MMRDRPNNATPSLGSAKRLGLVARDIVDHFENDHALA
jgi:hypothetical protein